MKRDVAVPLDCPDAVAPDREAASMRAAVQAELEQLRGAGEAPDGGCVVLKAMALYVQHDPSIPSWLRTAFLGRHARVTGAYVATWDDRAAFGRPWQKGIGAKRLAAARARLELMRRVHAAAWSLVRADLTRGVGKILFDEVSEQPGISVGSSSVERLYYAALRAGEPNVAEWRDAERKRCPTVSRNLEET
jgi:hypothetical protein